MGVPAAIMASAGLNALGSVWGANQQRKAANAAMALRRQFYGDAVSRQAPYQQFGAEGMNRLADMLGISGNTSAPGYGSLMHQFNPQDLQNEPGYQFQLNEGMRALMNRDSAAGTLGGAPSYMGNATPTAALRNAVTFGQGLAGTTYNQAFNRFMQQQQAQYERLAGTVGTGERAADTLTNAALGTGGQLAEDTLGLGNVRAAAGTAVGNAGQGALGDYLTYSMFGGGGGGNAGGGYTPSNNLNFAMAPATSSWDGSQPTNFQMGANDFSNYWSGGRS